MTWGLLKALLGIAVVAVIGFFIWRAFDNVQRLEKALDVVTADLATARDQIAIERGAAQAEARIGTRERIIIQEVDRGRTELAAAASGGRVVLLDAWARASRRLRDEPEAEPSGDPSAAADGA